MPRVQKFRVQKFVVQKSVVLPILVVGLLGLSGCGSSDSSGSPSSAGHMSGMAGTAAPSSSAGAAATGPHNAADVEFATSMIPHHAQAIEMANLVLQRTDNDQVKDLATRIEGAQSPEIATLSGWLTGWGEPVPDASTSMAGGMSMQGNGMMSDEDMQALESAPKSTVDVLFLTQMSEHHAGAIAMAEDEIASGANPQAKALAESIKKSQTAEVSEMKTLKASLA